MIVHCLAVCCYSATTDLYYKAQFAEYLKGFYQVHIWLIKNANIYIYL